MTMKKYIYIKKTEKKYKACLGSRKKIFNHLVESGESVQTYSTGVFQILFQYVMDVNKRQVKCRVGATTASP